jgi:hypothetical protein
MVEKLKKHLGCLSVDIYPFVTLCALDIICGERMVLSICNIIIPFPLTKNKFK